jgi:hypothetical protein
MNHIMKLAHNLLQYFCYNNPTNQAKLYELYFSDYQQISEVDFWRWRLFLIDFYLLVGTRSGNMLLYIYE